MKSKVYSIKEVATMLDIESYVLRYYEKELELEIHRNAQGHRIYDDKDIEMLRQIKDFREQGLELKAIRNVLHNLDDEGVEALMHIGGKMQIPQDKESVPTTELDITDLENDKVQQFNLMIKDSLVQALMEFNGDTKEQIKEELSDEMDYMVNKKMREMEVAHAQKNESYYNHMDEVMREMQKVRREMAAQGR